MQDKTLHIHFHYTTEVNCYFIAIPRSHGGGGGGGVTSNYTFILLLKLQTLMLHNHFFFCTYVYTVNIAMLHVVYGSIISEHR